MTRLTPWAEDPRQLLCVLSSVTSSTGMGQMLVNVAEQASVGELKVNTSGQDKW